MISQYKNYILIIVSLLVVTAIFYTGSRYGYNTCKAEEAKAIKKAIEKTKKEYEKKLNRNRREKKQALKLIAQLQNRPKVRPNEIENAAEKSDCKHLGIDFNRVYNKTIGKPPD